MHGLYFYFSHPLQSFKLHLYKMKPLRLFMNLIIKKIINFYLALSKKCHSLIDISILKGRKLMSNARAFMTRIHGDLIVSQRLFIIQALL